MFSYSISKQLINDENDNCSHQGFQLRIVNHGYSLFSGLKAQCDGL
jgi:hypothetical protein